jgi:hypothetical protein
LQHQQQQNRCMSQVVRATLIYELDHGSKITAFEFTSDGTRIITLDASNRVCVLNAINGKLLRTMEPRDCLTSVSSFFATSNDNRLLAIVRTGYDDRDLMIYDLDDASIVPIRISLDRHIIHTLRFTPTRQMIVVTSNADSYIIKLYPTWPAPNTTPSFIVENVYSLRVSPNGAFACIQDARLGAVRILQTQSLTFCQGYTDHSGYTPNMYDTGLVIPAFGVGRIFELDAGGVYKLQNRNIPNRAIVSPSCLLYAYMSTFTTAATSATLWVCRTANTSVVCTCHSERFRVSDDFCFSKDETSIIIYNNAFFHSGVVHMVDIATQRLSTFATDSRISHKQWSPTNCMQMVAAQGQRLISYDLARRATVRRIGRALVDSQTCDRDRQQMRLGIGAIILDYLGISRLVDHATFASVPTTNMTTRSMKRKRE